MTSLGANILEPRVCEDPPNTEPPTLPRHTYFCPTKSLWKINSHERSGKKTKSGFFIMSWAGAQAGRALGRDTELKHRRGPTTSMRFSAEPRPHVLLSAGWIRPGCQRCSWETENREARVGTWAPRGQPRLCLAIQRREEGTRAEENRLLSL